MTKCGSASPKKWQHGCSAHSYCTCPSFPHFWTFPSCFTELGAAPWTEFVSFPTRERLHLPPRLPSTEVPDLAFFLFFFPPFFVQEGARMLHLTKTYLISIFSPLCYFLCILIKQGEKKTPVGLKIVALNVQSSVCLEMNIQDSCCVLKDPRVAGLLWSSSQQNVFYWLSK